jgi:hypothetical protein
MKRFYCKLCQRIVRSRSLPKDAAYIAALDLNQLPKVVAASNSRVIGTCHQHPRQERSIARDLAETERVFRVTGKNAAPKDDSYSDRTMGGDLPESW